MRIPAVFMRGGTSRAIFFKEADLPFESAVRDRIILAAMGSPDSHGRQLDGMGGGISSLSKAAIIGPPTRPDADVNYTFGQVSVTDALTAAMCLGVAARIPETVVQEAIGPAAASDPSADIRLGHASGVLPIAAEVHGSHAVKVVVYRTARRLMEGSIRVPVRVLRGVS